MDPSATKTALRRALLERRRQLAPAAVAERSERLTRALTDHPAWTAARGVAGFVGVGGEPDTRALLVAALASGKRLWLPRVLRDAGRLDFVAVDDLACLAPAAFGLLEPRACAGERTCMHPDDDVDLILVPGLAFDHQGARLGFGKGYYDRALGPLRARGAPLRVGVCFGEFLGPAEGAIPMAPWDVPVHAVVTEDGVVLASA